MAKTHKQLDCTYGNAAATATIGFYFADLPDEDNPRAAGHPLVIQRWIAAMAGCRVPSNRAIWATVAISAKLEQIGKPKVLADQVGGRVQMSQMGKMSKKWQRLI
ncbi:hypothetical protein E8E14_008212 [Neopestalotiopsis sp. 37M]|nr:hypothetical protein E8E14_008212 [Neopestalotiopsis sp. 37M]